MTEDLTLEKIQEAIESERATSRQLINCFFNLLFWKNHGEGYVNVNDKGKIIDEIKNSTDTEKILPFVNKIRKQIGLPELTIKLNNILMEMTDEVRKRLILKGLE